ncbi:MAG: hypothetical protein K8F91_19370, partial [Candidatus Obscuribacterales bacterium]|nr:hypothetical protein [Candidatus Obscuribacterales bacterium]
MSNAKFFEQPYPFESKTEGESKEQSVNPLYEEAYSDFAPRGKNGALNHSDDDDCAIDYSPEGSFFNPNEPSYRGRAGDTSWRASPYEKEAPGDPQKMIEDLGKMLEAVTRELARTRSSDRNFYSNRMPGTQEAPIEYTRLIGLKAPALKKLVDPLIERVDTDGDGFLSKKEVVAGVKNHDIEREEAILLCVIKSNLSDIEELSNDETGDENDGATRKDIMKVLDDLIDYNEKTSVAWAVGDYGQEHFQILDKDKDGFLTESEVRTGKGSTEEEIEALRNMRRLFNDIQSASNDEWGTDNNGLTKSDLEEYFGKEFDRHDWELMRKVENDIAGGALN